MMCSKNPEGGSIPSGFFLGIAGDGGQPVKPYDRHPWYRLEALEGEVHAAGDTWRKLIQIDGLPVLLLQRGAWCGVRQEAFVLETPEEVAQWQTVL